jgi:hypothetical protein
MLLFKYLLMTSGIGLIAVAAAIIAYDVFLRLQFRRSGGRAGAGPLADDGRFLRAGMGAHADRGEYRRGP